MDIAKITSKGQITLPKAVRTRMAVRAGDQLTFEFESNGDVRLRALRHELKDGEVQACRECCGGPHGNVKPDVDAPEMAFELLPGEHVFHELRCIVGDLLAGT